MNKLLPLLFAIIFPLAIQSQSHTQFKVFAVDSPTATPIVDEDYRYSSLTDFYNKNAVDGSYTFLPKYGVQFESELSNSVSDNTFYTQNNTQCGVSFDGGGPVVGPSISTPIVSAYQDYQNQCSGLAPVDCAEKYSTKYKYTFRYSGLAAGSTIQFPFVWWDGASQMTPLPPSYSTVANSSHWIWGTALYFDQTSIRLPQSTHDVWVWNFVRNLITTSTANKQNTSAPTYYVPYALVPSGKIADFTVQITIPAAWRNKFKPFVSTCAVTDDGISADATAQVAATSTRAVALTQTAQVYPTVPQATNTPIATVANNTTATAAAKTRTAVAATSPTPNIAFRINTQWPDVLNGVYNSLQIDCNAWSTSNCALQVQRTQSIATSLQWGFRMWNETQNKGVDLLCSVTNYICTVDYQQLGYNTHDVVQIKCPITTNVHCAAQINMNTNVFVVRSNVGVPINSAATATAYYSQRTAVAQPATPTNWVVNTIVPATAVATTSSAATMTRQAVLRQTATAITNATRAAGTATRAVALTRVAATATAQYAPTVPVNFTATALANIVQTAQAQLTVTAIAEYTQSTKVADAMFSFGSDPKIIQKLQNDTKTLPFFESIFFLRDTIISTLNNWNQLSINRSCSDLVMPWSRNDTWIITPNLAVGMCALRTFFLDWYYAPMIKNVFSIGLGLSVLFYLSYWIIMRSK